MAGLNLSTRIIGLIMLGLMLMAALVIWRSEEVLEQTILEQTKQQVLVYLLGLEREIQQGGVPSDAAHVTRVLKAAIQEDGRLGFSIHQIYAYDQDGRVYAYVGPEQVPAPRRLEGYYGEVLRSGRPYMGQKVERYLDSHSGRSVHRTDIIIPLHEGNKVIGGLEVEIDFDATVALIKAWDDRFESQIYVIVGLTSLFVLVFIALVVRHGLIRPIQRLKETTARIAEGELDVRILPVGTGEIGQLNSAVNHMAQSIETLFNEQEQAYMQALQALSKALQAKDAYTAKHSARVAKYAVLLGRRLGLDERQLRLLKQGALMHDLGKIGIADGVLNKAGPLDEAEYDVMREHPVYTAAIMRPLKRFREFTEIAAWHHERWDGKGYPDGLRGEQIPLLARIVSIADTWDAMTGDRVYRKGMDTATALAIFERERDSGQWDPHLVDVFVGMVRGEIEARQGVEDDMFAEPVLQSE